MEKRMKSQHVLAYFEHFFFQAVEAETAHVIEKMTSDLQIYCRNKPLLQSTPHIGKVNIVLTQISVNQEFYRELLPLQ